MSLEANKAVVRRYFEEFINNKKLDIINEIMLPKHIYHKPWETKEIDHDECNASMSGFLEAVPDFQEQIHSIVAESDFVAVFHTRSGTFKNQWSDLPPTGKSGSDMWAFHLFRLADGKIAEMWYLPDTQTVSNILHND